MKPPNTVAERAILEHERDELIDDIEKTKVLLQEEVKAEVDEGDPGLFDREMYRALLTTLEKKLESVNAALRAIDKGRYGTCERCGQQIDHLSLNIPRPWPATNVGDALVINGNHGNAI